MIKTLFVIPAEAGIQSVEKLLHIIVDSRLRGNDIIGTDENSRRSKKYNREITRERF